MNYDDGPSSLGEGRVVWLPGWVGLRMEMMVRLMGSDQKWRLRRGKIGVAFVVRGPW